MNSSIFIRWTCLFAVLALSTTMGWSLMRPKAAPDAELLRDLILDGRVSELSRVLADADVDVNQVDSWGLSPLAHAVIVARYSGPEVIQLLLDSGADVNRADVHRTTPLMYAVAQGDESTVELLLRSGADPQARRRDGGTVLHTCVMSESGPRVTRMLLAAGADPSIRDTSGTTPSECARDAALIELADMLEKPEENATARVAGVIR